MNIPEHKPDGHTNELPFIFDSWLEFYDWLKPEHKEVTVLRMHHRVDDKVYNYAIDRDYYLARVAEELLPSRYSQQELGVIQHLASIGNGYSPHAIDSPEDFLGRVWKVALR